MAARLVRVHSEEAVRFWRKLTLPQEEKDPHAPKWAGGYRWFRDPNVICFEHYRREAPQVGSLAREIV
jgi:hypothetical protein